MKSWFAIGLSTLAAFAGSAAADVVDLTANTFGVLNGARFERADFRPAGSGYINSFVRVSSNKPIVQGYNTSGRPVAFDENTSPTFTRNITFGMIPQIVIDDVAYAEFFLDINQQSSSPFLSLDEVQIYTSNSQSLTTSNLASLGALVYDMDLPGDNHVKLDYNLNSGSGQGDMRLLVPAAAFGAAGPNTFVYLYSLFGENFENNDGYEEWAVREGMPIIPLPPAVLIGGVGLLGAGIARRFIRPS